MKKNCAARAWELGLHAPLLLFQPTWRLLRRLPLLRSEAALEAATVAASTGAGRVPADTEVPAVRVVIATAVAVPAAAATAGPANTRFRSKHEPARHDRRHCHPVWAWR